MTCVHGHQFFNITNLVHSSSMAGKTRLQGSHLGSEKICDMMDAWLTRRGSKDLDGLMRAIKDIFPSRASPTLPEVLRYADLAAAFVPVDSTLKPSHLQTYLGLLLLHKKFPCLSGGNIMVTARSTSGYIRTALRWFRDLATDPEKRGVRSG